MTMALPIADVERPAGHALEVQSIPGIGILANSSRLIRNRQAAHD